MELARNPRTSLKFHIVVEGTFGAFIRQSKMTLSLQKQITFGKRIFSMGVKAILVSLLTLTVVSATTLTTVSRSIRVDPLSNSSKVLNFTTLANAPASLRTAINRNLGVTSSGNRQIAASYSSQSAHLSGSDFGFVIGRGSIRRGSTSRAVGSALERVVGGVRYGSGLLSESFKSTSTGIEQIFRVAKRLGGAGSLEVDVPLSGLNSQSNRGLISLIDASGQVRATYSDLKVTDATGRRLKASMISANDGREIKINVNDAEAKYPIVVDPSYTPVSEITGSGDLGFSLAMTGNTAILGAPKTTVSSNTSQGAAYVYTLSSGTWSQSAELTASDGASGDNFGWSVSISGSKVVVGAPMHTVSSNTNQGAAYVYTLSSGTWSQSAELTASDGASGDLFGGSVAIDGTHALVGAAGVVANYGGTPVISHGNQGAAYVYTLSSGTWSQSAELTASDGASGDDFGWSVAISGGNLVVGAPLHTVSGSANQGAAYVYTLSSGTWSQSAELTDTTSEIEHFGWSVAISGTTMLVGTPGDNSFGFGGGGATYVYGLSGSTWSLTATLSLGSECCAGFGDSVAISGSTILVGSAGVAPEAFSGSAYIFTLSGGTWVQSGEYTLSGSEPEYVGWSVALSGTTAFVGTTSTSSTVYVYSTGIAVAPESMLALSSGDAGKNQTTCTSGSDPINCASGDFWHTFTDSSISGFGPGIRLTRSYNSQTATSEGIFGYGWSSSYDSHLVVNLDGSITITDDDGSQVTAEPDGSGGYVMPTSSDSTLTSSGGNFIYNRQGLETFTFNSSGQLMTLADPNGYSTTLTYSSGKLTTITDSSGRTVTLAYGTNGLVSSITDPLSRETTYAYDSSGDLTSVTDPLSHVTSFTYNTTSHLMLTMTFPNGQSGGPDAGDSVTNTYNGSGQVLTQIDQMGRETTYAYTGDNFSDAGGTTTITDPNGNVEVQDYLNGTLLSMTKGYGTASAATWSYEYDPTSLGLSSTTDPDGNVTTKTYDASGNLLANTNALGNTATYSYNSFNERTCAAKPLSANPCSSLSPPSAITAGTATVSPPSSAPPAFATYSEYDTKGNLIYQTTGEYLPGISTATQSRTTYDLFNGESVTLGSASDSCTNTAPSSELPCATINADGVVTQLGYDTYGDLTSKSTPYKSLASSPGTISTFAGGPMGSVTATQIFQDAQQVTTADVGGTNYAYVADPNNNVVRRINLATDAETVVAGNYAWGNYGNAGPATSAQLGSPTGVAVDGSGDLVIADNGNNVVRYVPASSGTYFGVSMAAGDIYTIAGNGTAGYSGNGGIATGAKLSGAKQVAFDASGVVIADTGNNVVRFVPLTSGTYFGVAMTAGDIYAIAGNATAGYSGNGGAATSAKLSSPSGVTVDPAGDVAIADTSNNAVRFVPVSSGTDFGQSMTVNDIYTVAGNATGGYSGNGGAATSAEIYAPNGVAFDASGDLAIADNYNDVVRFVPASSGTFFGQSMTANDIYTVAGNHTWGNAGNGGAATSAEMHGVIGVAIDANGNLVLSDPYLCQVRVVAASSGTLAGQSVTANDIYAFAGSGSTTAATYSGPLSNAEFTGPSSVRVDAAGDVVIADTGNHAVRFVPATSGTFYGQTMTAHDIYTIAGNGTAGYSSDGAVGTSAKLHSPGGVAVDASGDVAIADTTNNVVRFVPTTSGTYFGVSMTGGDIYTIVGNGTAGYSGDGGAATTAELTTPKAVAFDGAGDLLIADSGNNVVRFVPATTGTYYGQSMTAHDIYTIAGNGTAGYTGDGGAATSAELATPNGVHFDGAGNLLVADHGNNVVRFVPATTGTYFGQSMTANHVYTIAGNGTSGYSGDGGAATSAKLSSAVDAAFDASGNLLIADTGNDVVRFVPTTSGEFYGQAMTANDIYTIAGAGWSSSHFAGDGGPPLNAQFGWLMSIAPTSTGGFYLADFVDQRVRYVADTAPSDVATTTYTFDADGEKTSVTLPNGNLTGANSANYTTTYTYNAGSELTASTTAGITGATVTARTTSYGYDGDGNATSMTDARGYTTDFTYNADDEKTLVTDPIGNATLTCYDGDGNVAETVPPVGVAADSLTPASCPTSYPTGYGDRLATDATTTSYNALSEKTIITTAAPAGLSGHETTTYAYDLAGRVTTLTAPPSSNTGGAANNVTDYTYDNAGELLTTTAGAGTATASTSSNCYDPNGEVAATVAADGNVSSVATCSSSSPYGTSSAYQTSYNYDSLGQLVTQTAPETSAAPSGEVTMYTYDPLGNELTIENPDGVTLTNTYTPLSQLASMSYSGGTHDVTFNYDADGNETQMFDASGISTSSFDPFGEITSTTNGLNKTVAYSYDLNGNVSGITYPLGSGATWASTDAIGYGYDHADNLTSVTDFNGHTSTVTVSSDGLPSALTLGASGDTITTDYAANDGASSITLGNGSSLQSFTYSDVPSGGIASETDTPSSSLSPAGYTYDAQNQVTQNTPGSGSAKSYVEDASGNLTTLPNGASGTYNDASELTSSVLSGTTTNSTYDAAGNKIGSSVAGTATVTATYSGSAELTSYQNSAANTSSATYNGVGLRTAVTTTPSGGSASTQNFVWDTIASIPELLQDSTNAYIYGPNRTPFEEVNLSTGTIRYLVADEIGSVRGVVSSSGSLSASTSYDAWGNPETTGGLVSYTPFGFAGGYTDLTNLIYLLNRYYDPNVGQFISVDPLVGQTGQAYEYAGANPVTNIDPNGTDTEGYCVNATIELAGGTVGGDFCLVEANGNKQVGFTFTGYSQAGVSNMAILSYIEKNPFSLASLFNGSAGLLYQASNANSICQLGGVFQTYGGAASFGKVGASYEHFSGNGIAGNSFGVSASLFGVGGYNAGPGLEDTSITHKVSGNAKTIIQNVISALNIVNPLHWLASPLNLYSNGHS